MSPGQRALLEEAREQIRERQADYAENLRTACDETGQDPLLTQLAAARAAREAADRHPPTAPVEGLLDRSRPVRLP